jgi:two-component system LytT family sensor kinase
MKIFPWPKLKVYGFLVPMPFIVAMLHLIMYEDRIWHESMIWLVSTPILYVLGYFSVVAHIKYDEAVERRFPGLHQTKQRVLRKMLITLFVMTPSVYFIFFVYHSFHILGYTFKLNHLWQGALVGLGVNIIFETLYEADYIFRKYKENRAENETLQQLSVHQEFDALKSQVNPHFLFN